MNERRRRDERIALRAPVRNVHPGALPSHFHVHGKDATFVSRSTSGQIGRPEELTGCTRRVEVDRVVLIPREQVDDAGALADAGSLTARERLARLAGQRGRGYVRAVLRGQRSEVFSMISAAALGCSTARNKGTCENRTTIRRDQLETRVLGALRHHPTEPALFAEFCEEFPREMNRVRSAGRQAIEAAHTELRKIDRDLDMLVDMILRGGAADRLTQRCSFWKSGSVNSRAL